jgi:L,D-peptidoglycan transpeptidase YkuD (ErfK/YbiS/YcfS/YnhG family)
MPSPPLRPIDLVVTGRRLGFMGRTFPCELGRGGIVPGSAKREGDGATPAGWHAICGLMYRPDRVGRSRLPRWAVPIGPCDLWSDDSADRDYNRLVRAPYPCSHERLHRADRQYDVVLLTGWNWPDAQAGRGSAIFVHIRRGPGRPTAGCIALRRSDLLWIVPRIRVQSRLIVRPGVLSGPRAGLRAAVRVGPDRS